MRILDIFYYRFLTDDGVRLSVGGVETYILNLARLAEEMVVGVRIFQFSSDSFERNYEKATVYGIKRGKTTNFNTLYKYASSKRTQGNIYVNIIANDSLIPNWKVPDSIVIQHGIGFDDNNHPNFPLILSFLYRAYKSYIRIKRIQNVSEVVCVDNNYICWYRTQTPRRNVRMIPILNFAALPGANSIVRDKSVVRIVFARRFVEIRGTRLFGPVAKHLLNKFDNIELVFAGEGPDEKYLAELFSNDDRVKFTHYDSSESVCFHQQFDIAVVPTIYSEGTSLSLLEAMSAGCAVVCTNIGGMTNVILNNFNGIMVSPNKEELFGALSNLVENVELRNRLAKNAQETIKESFSLERWNRQWKKFLCVKFDKTPRWRD